MDLCPCSSKKSYSKCCEPYIKGDVDVPTAEALMRSRYTAYAITDIDYVLKTTMAKHRTDMDPDAIKRWSEGSDWEKLEVINTEGGGVDDKKGRVEFIAHYKENGLYRKHHEIGIFKKQRNKWFYEDSEFPTPKTIIREEPKLGRNDPCYCGSGKKYKKCCANK